MSDLPQTLARLRILVVDDEANIRMTLSLCLEAEGHNVVTASNIEDALEEIARRAFDLVFLDLRLGMQNGLDYIPQIVQENPWTRVVVITAYASVDTAVEAMKRGASDYLPKPFEAAQVILVTQKVAERRELERKIAALQTAIGEMDPEADLPSAEPSMLATLELARQVAKSHASILIRGEVGTGKSRLARAIHVWSDRAGASFASVTCRADAGSALEAELFGAAGQASLKDQSGKVEVSNGGTLLLDEIGELPLRIQPRILSLLKDKEYERLEEVTRRKADVRLIATSSADLQETVDQGHFRADLLLALNVVQIDMPPLRQRPGDIPLLAERFVAFFGRQNRRPIVGFTPQAMHALQEHHWPGNARELRNVIERAVLICGAERIGIEHLPPNLLNAAPNISIGDLVPLSMVERMHIRRVVAGARSLRQAASILGIDAGTVCRRMKRYEATDDQPAA